MCPAAQHRQPTRWSPTIHVVTHASPLAHEILGLVAPGSGQTVVPPPGDGDGHWAGAPSAFADDSGVWLAYRLRRPLNEGRGYANVVAHAPDGVQFSTVATLTSEQFGAASLERPALVRLTQGGWRLYVSCSTPDSKHWWVEAVDAESPPLLPTGRRTIVLAGAEGDCAWKDPVVHRPAEGRGWQMWACRHPLDGDDAAADRMRSDFFTSTDGLSWVHEGPALTPTPGSWDARGARITSVGRTDQGSWTALYDGRASAEENFRERTGVATGEGPTSFLAADGPSPSGHVARYVCVVRVPGGGHRVYWEASLPDGSHDLRTAYLAGA